MFKKLVCSLALRLVFAALILFGFWHRVYEMGRWLGQWIERG